jgi:hypothetical protein
LNVATVTVFLPPARVVVRLEPTRKHARQRSVVEHAVAAERIVEHAPYRPVEPIADAHQRWTRLEPVVDDQPAGVCCTRLERQPAARRARSGVAAVVGEQHRLAVPRGRPDHHRPACLDAHPLEALVVVDRVLLRLERREAIVVDRRRRHATAATENDRRRQRPAAPDELEAIGDQAGDRELAACRDLIHPAADDHLVAHLHRRTFHGRDDEGRVRGSVVPVAGGVLQPEARPGVRRQHGRDDARDADHRFAEHRRRVSAALDPGQRRAPGRRSTEVGVDCEREHLRGLRCGRSCCRRPAPTCAGRLAGAGRT